MVGLDALLSVIENPARRKILEALAREPHYPLQLSTELGMSQQAVMKHLRVLESCGLVKSYREESDLGGPKRNKYYPTVNFTIVVDVGTNIFHAELTTREHEPSPGPGEEVKAAEARASDLRDRMREIDDKLLQIQRQREELIEEKESIMEEVSRFTSGLQDYQARRAMYEFISRPNLDPREIARELSLRDEVVLRYIRQWLEE